ncbi:Protein NSP-INTERACTING KINASE 2 [Linum perenne]
MQHHLHPLIPLFFLLCYTSLSSSSNELDLLLKIKTSLDPTGKRLTSWKPNSDPCSSSFEGVACNENGRIANISLQGKYLSGHIPPDIGQLTSLTGLYLHFNTLNGGIPPEISQLTNLTDLYLNVNDLSGEIPPQLSHLSNLQVLQLCFNRLSGNVPTQLGSLMKLNVLALQYNQLTGAIPASLGDLSFLTRLDLSFNSLFGSIPAKLADAPLLQFLDVSNNTLSGKVPSDLTRLGNGFQYDHNPSLCGFGFPNLTRCTGSFHKLDPGSNEPFKPTGAMPRPFEPNGAMPEPFEPNSVMPKPSIPESANLPAESKPSSAPKRPNYAIILGIVVGCFISMSAIGVLVVSWHRRRKQKIGSAFDASADNQGKEEEVKCKKSGGASPLLSIEYPNGWDPLGKSGGNGVSQEFLESLMFNLEEVERATQHFSETNLLGKSNFSATYKGVLRDGSVVAIKCITKTSCKSDEAEFLKGLKMLTSLKHESLVKLRGFCCSKGRGECFLIYDYVPNGNLLQYLDIEEGRSRNMHVLEWPTRVSIITGIAKGIAYLHGKKGLVHQNISAKKVMINSRYNPLLSESGLHKLLADDVVFSILKASAGMGYLCPEYTTTGRFTEKSDVYAFGVVILQVITGKSNITHHLTRHALTESFKTEDIVDPNLGGNYEESEVNQLGKMGLLCIHEAPSQRPRMEDLIRELAEVVATP